MANLRLEKYHGIGNDFLLLVDPDCSVEIDGAQTVALCDRHRGIGADGVIRLRSVAAADTIRMELRNADGGSAETSGNGLRCAALAALDHGLVSGPQLVIETDAGPVTATVRRGANGQAEVRVAMGLITVVAEHRAIEGCRVVEVDAGNPHLVLLTEDVTQLDLHRVGPELEASFPGGTNVELVAPGPNPGELRLVVWERGVGMTLACGSGSTAAALAAGFAGIAGDRVVVHNPGGPLTVELTKVDDRSAKAALTGPTAHVARILVDTHELGGAAGLPS